MQGFVTEYHAVKNARVVGIKQMTFQTRDAELMTMDGDPVAALKVTLHFHAAVVAFAHQFKQHIQAVVEVAPVAIFFAGQRDHLQIAQRFQAVTLQIGFGGHWRITQLRARFNVEQEQQAVHVTQTFAAQFIRVHRTVTGIVCQATVDQIMHRFVTQQLNAFAQGIFQIFRNTKRMFVRIVIQRVKIRCPTARQQRIFM